MYSWKSCTMLPLLQMLLRCELVFLPSEIYAKFPSKCLLNSTIHLQAFGFFLFAAKLPASLYSIGTIRIILNAWNANEGSCLDFCQLYKVEYFITTYNFISDISFSLQCYYCSSVSMCHFHPSLTVCISDFRLYTIFTAIIFIVFGYAYTFIHKTMSHFRNANFEYISKAHK